MLQCYAGYFNTQDPPNPYLQIRTHYSINCTAKKKGEGPKPAKDNLYTEHAC